MKVQYLGNNKRLKKGQEYNIDYVCGNKGGYVIVEDFHQIVYDDITDLALDWDILGKVFIRQDIVGEMMTMMAKLP